jgi:hypothetical protein
MVFLGDIAFYMATLVFAAGIYMVHHACHHDSGKPCRLLRSGGYIVIVISLLGMLCSGFYWLKYFSEGAYSTRQPSHHSMMMNKKMDNDMMGGMQHCMGEMKGKTMDPDMMMKMKSCMKQKGPNPSDENGMPKGDHEAHH